MTGIIYRVISLGAGLSIGREVKCRIGFVNRFLLRKIVTVFYNNKRAFFSHMKYLDKTFYHGI